MVRRGREGVAEAKVGDDRVRLRLTGGPQRQREGERGGKGEGKMEGKRENLKQTPHPAQSSKQGSVSQH